MADTTHLSNHLLIAMPQLADPTFAQTVMLVCEHGERGALGIILNRPLPMKLAEVFEQMKIEPSLPDVADLPVLRGGPVQAGRKGTHIVVDARQARRGGPRRGGRVRPIPRRAGVVLWPRPVGLGAGATTPARWADSRLC